MCNKLVNFKCNDKRNIYSIHVWCAINYSLMTFLELNVKSRYKDLGDFGVLEEVGDNSKYNDKRNIYSIHVWCVINYSLNKK